MSTIYLHIGTPKTGTTAIQNLLGKNRNVLKQRGILYPDYGFYYTGVAKLRNAHFLIHMDKSAENASCAPAVSADYGRGLEMLVESAAQFDTIILSDEKIWNGSLLIPNYWQNLKRDLEERKLSLRVIVYLRRQDLVMQSLYGHNIRHSSITSTFPEFIEDLLSRENPFCLDYYTNLCEIAGVIGWDSMIIRVYEKEQFCGPEGDLFSDFLQIFGLQMKDGFRMEQKRFNERMTKSHTEIRRILNHIPLPAGTEPLKSLWAVQDIRLPGDSDESYTWFAPGEQQKFMERYADGNSRLAQTYFGRADGVLFQAPIEDLPMFHVDDREILTHTILAYGKALRRLARENEELRAELNEIRALCEETAWHRLKRNAAHILKKKD